MFKKILVPTDGSELSSKAIDGAIDYAKAAGARLIGVAVVEPYGYAMVSEGAVAATACLLEFAEQAAKENLDLFAKRVKAAGLEYEVCLATNPSPWDEIVKVSQVRGCDAIFMASHGRRGLDALLLGSETHKVLVHSKLPVLVFR